MEIIIDDDGIMHKVFTKDEVVAMLTEIQLEIEELKSYESADGQDLAMIADIGILLQQKIDALKGGDESDEKSSGANDLSSNNTNRM